MVWRVPARVARPWQILAAAASVLLACSRDVSLGGLAGGAGGDADPGDALFDGSGGGDAAPPRVVTAASCARDDVAAAVAAARDGDTVSIPAGTCTWTRTLAVEDRVLTIAGAGVDQTVLVDGVNKDDAQNPAANFLSNVLAITTREGGVTRVTGLTFDGGDPPGTDYNRGMLLIRGTSRTWRVDHVKFENRLTSSIMVRDATFGVVDHCQFILRRGRSGAGAIGVQVHHDRWEGQGDWGDASWADVTDLGTGRAVFIEDNTFTFSEPGLGWAHLGLTGERVVFRHNTVSRATFHNLGTDTSGRARGGRTFEVYANTFVTDDEGSYDGVMGVSSGVGVIFDNTATGAHISRLAVVALPRSTAALAPWGRCDGTSPWDGNQMPNGYPCLDQVGRGAGALLDGNDPTPARWPNQLAEPTYVWGNTLNGAPGRLETSSPEHVAEGRDYFHAPRPGYAPYAYPHPLAQ